MAITNIEKARTVLQGVGSGDAILATKYISPATYAEHNPRAANGADGLREYTTSVAREEHHLRVVRAFQDNNFVFTQADGLILGQNTLFDVFRFENGLVVEHWVFSGKAGPPNKSGHTQVDGPVTAQDVESTAANKALMRDYYNTFHIARDHSRNDEFFTRDIMTRHEPGVQDGLGEFLSDVEKLMKHRTIGEIKLLLGQGNFVFIAAKGTHEGKPCAYIDLYCVANTKVVEHWGFPEKIPPQSDAENTSGFF